MIGRSLIILKIEKLPNLPQQVGGVCNKCGDVAVRKDIKLSHVNPLTGEVCQGRYHDMIGEDITPVNNKESKKQAS